MAATRPCDTQFLSPMQIIVNADDFGRSPTINAAVTRAHREGVLTSASLMVGGAARTEAVALAQTMPDLAVGLHLVLADGPAVLPPREIPHLVNQRGYFPADPVRLGLLYVLSRAARQELAQEITAQFESFLATGLPLSHVDGHLHMHMHPVAWRLLVPLAQQAGARGLRLPRDDLWLGLAYDHRQAWLKVTWALIFGALSRWGLHRTHGAGLIVTRRVYGLMQSGQMQEAYVLRLLQRLQEPTAEIYFHPDTVIGERLGPNPVDLATLLSPRVRQAIAAHHIRLSTYPTLRPE
jgi:hopanoid biosynthesis associated protein HpnK